MAVDYEALDLLAGEGNALRVYEDAQRSIPSHLEAERILQETGDESHAIPA